MYRYTGADCVDHIVPHRGSYELFWNQRNWQSLCKRCHDLKTGYENAGLLVYWPQHPLRFVLRFDPQHMDAATQRQITCDWLRRRCATRRKVSLSTQRLAVVVTTDRHAAFRAAEHFHATLLRWWI